MSAHEALQANIAAIHNLISGHGPDEHEERERLLWLLAGMYAGALTPRSNDEKRGMERVLAILERKRSDGGWSDAPGSTNFSRGRWSAFQECMIMLRGALNERSAST